MNDDSPGLGVDFQINTDGAFSELLRFAQMFDDKTLAFVRQAAQIESAIGGAITFKGASAKVKAFADSTQGDMRVAAAAVKEVERATDTLAQAAIRAAGISIIGPAETREAENTTRAINATATAIDKRILSLNREAAAIGLTKAELRAKADAELVATAATQGNTEAADRLYAALRNRDNLLRSDAEDRHVAAMRAETEAAQQEAAALARVNGELAERARLQAALDRTNGADRPRATDAGATFSALSARAAEEEARSVREAAQAYQMFEAAARRGAAALRDQEAAVVADAAALAHLRQMIDPAAAAHDRLNKELAEARRLMTAAGASAQELSAAEDALHARATRATQQYDTMAGAARRSSGALQNIALQLPDITQGLLTGQKPFTIFIQQGFQIVQVAQMAEGGLRGFGREVAGLALRFAPLLVGIAAAGAGFALFNRWINEGVKNDQLTRDLGKITGGADATKQELFKLKDATVSFASTAQATFSILGRDIATAFVGDMAAMSGGVKSILDDMTSYGRKTLAGMYAGIAGMKSYLGEVEKGGLLGLGKMLVGQGDPKLLEKTFGAAYNVADAYLGKLGARVRKEAVNIERQKLAEKIGFNNAPKPKVDRHAEQLARESAAIEAQIRNLYKLADAYGVSGAAALIAEARVKAESDAIKKRADIEERVARQIRLVVAERVKAAAQGAASLRDQEAAQREANAAMIAGQLPAEQAAAFIRDRLADLPLLHAMEAARIVNDVQGAREATEALRSQRAAQDELTDTEREGRRLAAEHSGKNRLSELREELRLVGATDMARAKALATLRATQTALAEGWGGKKALEYVEQQEEIAVAQQQVANATDDWNASLGATSELFDTIDQAAQRAASGMADAFGQVGATIGDVLTVMTGYYSQQARLQEEHDAAIEATHGNQTRIAQENRLFALRTSSAQIGAYGDMASAAKGFFKENSGGYKALAAAEKAFRTIQFAMSVRAMVQDASETVRSVLNSTARTAANATEGVSAQAKLPFPLNIAAMAATAAALVAAGISVLGGGGGGGAPPVRSAEDYQTAQGTGSVLGDASAKSESINKSLDLMMKNSNRDLEYSNEMVRSLRAIETNIGNLAAAVARETKVGGGLDASTLGLGANTSGGLLGIGGLFSKTITRELNDAGLQFDGTTVASAIAGGITANLYQEVLKTTKKSGFLGIGGSTKTTVETVRTAADSGLTSEVSLLIDSMRRAIVGAAGTIGIDGAAAMLDAFQINIGRISFQNLTSEEIEAELSAVFSRVGDDMAGAVGGGLVAFQRAGEGMLEALMRLAKEYTTVDVALRSIGMTFGAVGIASVGARTALVDLFGGLDEFTEQTDYFRENFLSEAEQMAPIIAAVGAEMARLGQAGVDTKDEFKALVLGLDLSSESGRETYAALMAVAPAFSKTSEYLASLNGELQQTGQTAAELASIAKQRRALDIQLLEATGDATGALAARRADELAALDETLRALQQNVWTAQDAAQATRDLTAAQAEADRAATALAAQRRGLEIELMEATGNATGALAARRADEIAALDATLRPIREQILAAQYAASAQAALASAQTEAAEAARALAQTRRGMEIELMEALGDASGALAARRADELAGTDASLRALREQIWAAQDAAAANATLAQAQQEAAASAAQAAQQLAAAAAQLAQQRSALGISLLRAQGNDAGATAAERALQLAATDETLRGLQEQVWAAEDARRAAEAAAQAQAAYAQQQQQFAQEAETLRKQRAGMDAQLLDLLGNAAGATALRRQEELAALNASLRPLQQSIWAQEDLAAAASAAADRVSTARDTLIDAYKRESDALGDTIERFTSFGDSLRKFRAGLGNGGDATVDAYRAAQARFVDTSALAARGDSDALADLEAISNDFLAASRERAGSLAEYQRDVARVAGSVDRAIGATDEAVDYAEAQLEALNTSVAGLIDINESVVSVRSAIVALQVAIAGAPAVTVPPPPTTSPGGTTQPVQVNTPELERRIDALSARLEVQNTAVAENTGKMSRMMDRWDGAGLLIRTDDDTPLHVTSIGA